MEMADRRIEKNVYEFIHGNENREVHRGPMQRYTSFDYCYNYFQRFYEDGNIEDIISEANIRRSCLEIGFYLASWGMYRSGDIRKKSVKRFEELLENIVNFDDEGIWDIDVDNYPNNYELILQCSTMVSSSFTEIHPTTTFISKVMLGIFGIIPAFDRFFLKGTRNHNLRINSICTNSLANIYDFYNEHKRVIDRLSGEIVTLDYSGGDTNRQYTKAKIIDMVFFIEGFNQND